MVRGRECILQEILKRKLTRETPQFQGPFAFAMNRIRRVSVEIFWPPLLAAIIIDIAKLHQDGITASLS
jgi:hypothetical protein